MNKSAFDKLLMQNVKNAMGFNCFGYEIDSRKFPEYYCAGAFADFVNQMKEEYHDHYEQYDKGKGNELKQKGETPPKMASVGSSSRFCYIALRNGADALGGGEKVEFEHPCPIRKIKGGTPPQMDAYEKKENIFVEVKCHEIFDSHKIVLSSQYFNHLYGEDNDFGFEVKKSESKEQFELFPSLFGGEKSSMLDIKQLICHLLGIKFHKSQEEQATLVYLFFKPKALEKSQREEIDDIFDKLKSEIRNVFNSTHIQTFIQKNNIKLKAVAEFSEVMAPLTSANIEYLY